MVDVSKQPAETDSADSYRPSAFTAAWVVWILFFVVVEGVALKRRNKNDTFSEFWWAIFRVRKATPKPVRAGLLVLQLGFAAWLVPHLVFGLMTT